MIREKRTRSYLFIYKGQIDRRNNRCLITTKRVREETKKTKIPQKLEGKSTLFQSISWGFSFKRRKVGGE